MTHRVRKPRRLQLESLEAREVLSSVTVVTHGAAPAIAGNSLSGLADELYQYWENLQPGQAALLQYQPSTGALALLKGSAAADNEVVLFDWLVESDALQPGYDEAAGDALFAMLVEHDLLESDYLHLIGFSRGTVVSSEAAQRLLHYGRQVDQMTLLDTNTGPAPLNAAGPAMAWEGIGFIDNYFGDGDVFPIIGSTGGEPVSGAYNVDLTVGDLGDVNGDGRVSHNEVSSWYASTVNDPQATEGFRWRRDLQDRPAADGSPAPLVAPPTVVNGDLRYGDNLLTHVAGWSFHGGSGTGDVQALGEAQLLVLRFLRGSRTHNRLYVPAGATHLEYRVWVTDPSHNDEFRVQLGGRVVDSFSLKPSAQAEARFGAWETRQIPLDALNLGGTVQTLSFEIASPGAFNLIDSEVRIDNVRFVPDSVPPAAGEIPPGADNQFGPLYRWIRSLYRDLLGREASVGDLSFFVDLVQRGLDPAAIARAFVFSVERRNVVINSLYQQYLGRAADPQGLAHWRAVWEATGGPEQVQAGIIASAEFYATAGGTAEAWVSALYRSLLGRTAGQAEIDFWANVAARAGRHQVVLGFAFSNEYRLGQVAQWYQQYLGRHIDNGAAQYWLGRLRAGLPQDAIQAALLASAEYRARL